MGILPSVFPWLQIREFESRTDADGCMILPFQTLTLYGIRFTGFFKLTVGLLTCSKLCI